MADGGIFEVVFDVIDVFVHVELEVELLVEGNLVIDEAEVVVIDDVIFSARQCLLDEKRHDGAEAGNEEFEKPGGRVVFAIQLHLYQSG